MTSETEQLAREMIRAEEHIKDATARQRFSEAQVWLETREKLADQRYVLIRENIYPHRPIKRLVA